MRPTRTPAALLDRLEEQAAERHREAVQRLAPIERPACVRHGWHPPGPGSQNMDALASLCPHCQAERRQREREEKQAETRTIELNVNSAGAYADRLWKAQRKARIEAGEVFPDTTVERETLRYIDSARLDEEHDLRETADDRRVRSEEHWGRHFRVHSRRQRYVPHPARAGD